jgi:(p)ppGpp synthase/HD superfamily hydrolase
MHSYAQINIQLYEQMRCREYSQSDIIAVHRAYSHALQWMSGRFRPSGKPLQDHLVGTASILVERRAPLKLLIVAILHAAHEEGDFGALANLSAQAKQRQIESALNSEAAALLTAYANFAWNTQAILRAAENFENLSDRERDVIFLRLANDLEDNLDEAVLYCPNREVRLEYLKKCGPAMVKMATLLDQHTLADELARSHCAQLETENRQDFPIATAHGSSWIAAPLSHRKRFLHALAPPILHNARRGARKVRRVLAAKSSGTKNT